MYLVTLVFSSLPCLYFLQHTFGFVCLFVHLWFFWFVLTPEHTHTKQTNQNLTRNSVCLRRTCGLVGFIVQNTLLGDSWLSVSFSFYLWTIQIPQTRILKGKITQLLKGSWRSMQTFSYSPYLYNLSSSRCFQSSFPKDKSQAFYQFRGSNLGL